MSIMKNIEIDFDIHKKIEAARKSFSETPNDVLRRLLHLKEKANQEKNIAQHEASSWRGKGVILPHGTKLRMSYKGEMLYGVINNGRWVINNKDYDSPSAAAIAAVSKAFGKYHALNGWNYWEAQLPNDSSWKKISLLRLLG